MKKFIYTLVLLAGFQFAQAQQVTVVFFYEATNPLGSRPLDSLELILPSGVGTSIPLPLLFVIRNNGTRDINAGDTIVIQSTFNGIVKTLWAPMPERIEIDSMEIFTSDLEIDVSTIRAGQYANELCLSVSSIIYSGVRTPISKPSHCSKFTVTGEGVGIADVDNLQSLKIFPNPVRDNNLKIENIEEATDVQIYNITGQLIQKETAVMGDVNMDVSNLSNGIYILRMQSGKNIRTEKIQIIR